MKHVLKVRMLPTEEQAAALQATLRTCNEAASWLSGRVHADPDRVRRKHDVQKRFYAELKGRFGLSAQPAIRVIGKVADAYSSLRANVDAGNYGPPGSTRRNAVSAKPIGFRPEGAQPFDARCLSWQTPGTVDVREATVSIWTTRGRLRDIRIIAAAGDLVRLRTRSIGETDLICRDGKWFLYATVDEPEVPLAEPTNGFLGVDMGIVNIATTSVGNQASGARLNSYRKRHARPASRPTSTTRSPNASWPRLNAPDAASPSKN